jgi:ribonuclease BN (tRNA processing enzyme)
MLFALRNPEGPIREQPLSIFAPPGFRRFLADLTAVFGRHLEPRCPIEIEEVSPSRRADLDGGPPAFAVGCASVWAAEMAHDPSQVCLGYRIVEADTTLAVTGDTAECEAAIDLARGADCLVAECSVPSASPVEGHLTPQGAGRLAAAAGCGRLVLVHMYPSCQPDAACAEAAELCSCPVSAAEDGEIIDLGLPSRGGPSSNG